MVDGDLLAHEPLHDLPLHDLEHLREEDACWRLALRRSRVLPMRDPASSNLRFLDRLGPRAAAQALLARQAPGYRQPSEHARYRRRCGPCRRREDGP
jgi:hypothetical protein